jgi:hypothetical protein
MAKVTVVLPDNKRGPAKINPSSKINEVRNELVTMLIQAGLLPPSSKVEDYGIAIMSMDSQTEVSSINLKDGDFIFIIDRGRSHGAAVDKIDPHEFQ